MSVRIMIGDVREKLAELADESVHCVVTSPPYFGLRDYGVAGQIGLEPTPAEFVAVMVEVFREVRRVLRKDGTLWLNLGDSYAASSRSQGASLKSTLATRPTADKTAAQRELGSRPCEIPDGFKSKDLMGIPWSVAKALQAPYYTGRIAAERDRVWLAAIMDGEGTICGFDHDRADNGTHRSGIHIFMTNSSMALLDEAARIWPTSRSEHGRPGPGHLGDLPTWRWIVHGIANKQAVLREIYPHLIAKRQQAVVAYSMLLLMENAKRLGHSSLKDETIAKRAVCTALLSDLNHQRPVVMPDWLTEPPTMFEPGWYLRQDLIWSKPNPMPESVTDRCTKSHEYMFLFSRSPRYHYDAEAIAEAVTESTVERLSQPNLEHQAGSDRVPGKTNGTMKAVSRSGIGSQHKQAELGQNSGPTSRLGANYGPPLRNRRSVWTVATQPFKEAHFATFPPDLIEPCIKAGCPKGGTVLDPFGGAGTTGLVADRLGRDAVLIELNPEYAAIAMSRIKGDSTLFAEVEAA